MASAGGCGHRERQPHWAVTRHMCPHAYQAGTAMASSSSRLLSVPLSVCLSGLFTRYVPWAGLQASMITNPWPWEHVIRGRFPEE